MTKILPPESGPCECKYKLSCHVPRQYVQSLAKKEDPEHICRFYVYFADDIKLLFNRPKAIESDESAQ